MRASCSWGYNFMRAVMDSDLDEIALLLKEPECNVNYQSCDGQTALHFAIEDNNCEVVSMLIKCPEIDINIQSKTGMTPLMKIMEIYGLVHLFYDTFLSREDLKINLTTHDGWNALTFAAFGGRTYAMQQLIRHGANVSTIVEKLKCKTESDLRMTRQFTSRGITWSDTLYKGIDDDVKQILYNWKQYLPEWTMWNHYCFPQEFKEIVVAWLLVVAKQKYIRKCVNKDMRRYMVQFIAAAYKFG